MSALLLLLVSAGPSAADAGEAAARVLERGDYQTALPGANAEAPHRPPPIDDRREFREPSRTPDGVSGVASAVWWVLIGVILLVLAIFLLREFGRPRAEVSARRPPPAARAPASPRPRLPDAAQLAEDGRYGDAIHALLQGVVRDLASRRQVASAWTHREIARRIELEPEAHRAFLALIGAVEAWLFGGAPGREKNYVACRAHAEAVRAALPRRSA